MRIGTRGSALALAQAAWVAERLGADSELVTITTSGDRDAARGDKSRWVSELDRTGVARAAMYAAENMSPAPVGSTSSPSADTCSTVPSA